MFHRWLKSESAKQGISMIEFSKEFGERKLGFVRPQKESEIREAERKKKRGLMFRL